MIVSGRRAISPRYIREIRIEEDEYGVMLRIVAIMQGGKVILKQANQYEESDAPYKIRGYYERCLKEMDGLGYGKSSG